jgi:hypothetical protein
VYNSESHPPLMGVPLPGRRREGGRLAAHTVAGILDPARQPQTLEELLERHWEQGSRFLMEQASHFDIASLLSSLHQLKEENVGLEDNVDRLLSRRDHLLAVRSRLLALNSLNLATNASGGHHAADLARRDAPQPPPVQNGPNSMAAAGDKRLVSPMSGGRVHASPGMEKQALPSPRDRLSSSSSLPSPLERSAAQPSPRDRSPRLPLPLPAENGMESMYRNSSSAASQQLPQQLLTVAHSVDSQQRQSQQQQQAPIGSSGLPKPAHYSHSTSLPPHSRHSELRGHYSSNAYQMVSPPPHSKGIVPLTSGPPLPAHSASHASHHAARAAPPPARSQQQPHHPVSAHHGDQLPPNLRHLMRASYQSQMQPNNKK